jgi:hypothetical protein
VAVHVAHEPERDGALMVIAGLLAAACFAYGWLAFALAEHAIDEAEAQRQKR